MAAAASASKAKTGTWTGTFTGAGTVGYFRITTSAGNAATSCEIQGTVTATGGGGDMTLDNTTAAASQAWTVNTFTIAVATANT
jgi:hypothetical protein